MTALWRCVSLIRRSAVVVIKRGPSQPAHHAHRIGHAVARHKVGWLCVAIVADGAGIWGLPATPPVEHRGAGPVDYWPPESGIEDIGPLAFFGPPDFPFPLPAPQPEQPSPETQPPQPVAEPSALALLLPGLAALAIGRAIR